MGYSKDGPCRKLTSLFFKDKKFIISSAADLKVKNKIERNKSIEKK